ncbi:hypothetical protein M0R45_034246 [Rubus argutus]|uniref:Reverse transcriptase Ty1/copia-type domain-containing protein n=1 Tax=Rubus argutus TaxID=59490 RepID=A0AAW1VSL1_RUBAR
MGPQRRMGIYVGFESPTIIRYVEPLTGDLFTARFADCHFDETVFPSLGGDKNVTIQQERRELSWPVPTLSHNDPPTAQRETKRRKCHPKCWAGQGIAGATPNVGGDVAQAVAPPRKRGRPQGSRDTHPRKRAAKAHDPLIIDTQNPTHENIPDYGYVQETSLEDAPSLEPIRENVEISINYTSVHGTWDRNSIVVDDVFAYACARELIESDDIEPRSVDECQRRADWPEWKNAIQAELDSLTKRTVFGPVVPIPSGIKPVGYKWVFVRKRNEKNEIVRYKARLVWFLSTPWNRLRGDLLSRNGRHYVPLPYQFGSFRKTEYAAYGCGHGVSLWGSRYGNIHEGS